MNLASKLNIAEKRTQRWALGLFVEWPDNKGWQKDPIIRFIKHSFVCWRCEKRIEGDYGKQRRYCADCNIALAKYHNSTNYRRKIKRAILSFLSLPKRK